MHERVGKLEAAGVIRAYRAEVEPEAVGLGVTAFIGIVQDVDSDIDDIVASMSELPEIESCYFLAGVESFLLMVRVRADRRAGAVDRAAEPDPRGGLDPDHIALSTKWEARPLPLPPAAARDRRRPDRPP